MHKVSRVAGMFRGSFAPPERLKTTVLDHGWETRKPHRLRDIFSGP